MLTLDLLDDIELSAKPWGQIAVAAGLLTPNYHFPPTRTDIELEGTEHLEFDEPVVFAMNHTDRFNYWPFQYRLWRDRGQYTTTWVKGKYFNNPVLRTVLIETNNLAVPSRGYLITTDATEVLGHRPADETYRLLRDAVDENDRDIGALRRRAQRRGVLAEVTAVVDTPRDMLGVGFDPLEDNYVETMTELFGRMMEKFVELNEQALGLGLNILVFPEGTRSVRLGPGRPGLAQMALRMQTPVVPVGCNGSDRVYPGDAPIARGGRIVYRVGRPLTFEDELAEFQIDEAFTPFTDRAEERHGEKFRAMTDLIMERIEGLLDQRHRPSSTSQDNSTA